MEEGGRRTERARRLEGQKSRRLGGRKDRRLEVEKMRRQEYGGQRTGKDRGRRSDGWMIRMNRMLGWEKPGVGDRRRARIEVEFDLPAYLL